MTAWVLRRHKATLGVSSSIPRMMSVGGRVVPQQMLISCAFNEPVDGAVRPRYLIYIIVEGVAEPSIGEGSRRGQSIIK